MQERRLVFVNQLPPKEWFTDAPTGVSGGVCTVKSVYYELPEDMTKRTTGGERGVNEFISINLLEVMTAVINAHIMVVMRGDRSGRVRRMVLIRSDNEAAVASIKKCTGGDRTQEREWGH